MGQPCPVDHTSLLPDPLNFLSSEDQSIECPLQLFWVFCCQHKVCVSVSILDPLQEEDHWRVNINEMTFLSVELDHCPQLYGPRVDKNCGGNLTKSSGVITSHPFHGNFTGVSECFWYINVDPTKVIQLKFTALSISSDEYWYNYIEIYDGLNSSSPSLGIFYNLLTATDVLSSSTNSLTLKYKI
ncbi:CUB and sushi domain-containing protein 3, partial [Bulinus truncatus]